MSRPTSFTWLGAIIYSSAITAFAVQNLFGAETVLGLEPLPSWLPGFHVWAILNTLVLLGGGIGIILLRATGRRAALPAVAVGAILLLWIVLLHPRVLLAHAHDGGYWGCLIETLAIDCGAWVLAGMDSDAGKMNGLSRWATTLGRLGYGVTLLGFGGFHLVYPGYIASVVPAWLPGHMFWVYFTAAAFFAGAAGILSGIKAYYAAAWTGIMLLSWVPLVHLPRVIHDPRNRDELSSLIVAVAVGGGAWIVAQSLEKARVMASPPP